MVVMTMLGLKADFFMVVWNDGNSCMEWHTCKERVLFGRS